MNDDDIDDSLKEKWNEVVLNPYNDKLINQEIDEPADLTELFETGQNITNLLRYRAKFYFIIGRYGQAHADLTKLLEIEPNDAFALRYRGETCHMVGEYEESLADLNNLLKINANDKWALKACEEVTR